MDVTFYIREQFGAMRIACSNQTIADEPAVLCAQHICSGKSISEIFCAERKIFPQRGSQCFWFGLETWVSFKRKSIPRTNILAIIATENPVADQWTQLHWNRSPQL